MREKRTVQPGGEFGRWTALEPGEITAKGEQKWRCRCVCGAEREVLARALLYGLSTSCGCLTRERARETNAMNLLGQTFGDLTVVARAPKEGRNGGARWTCRCACGESCVFLGTLLAGGKRTHCGCKTVKNYAFSDIAGQSFGRLTALEPTDKRDMSGGAVWRCRCACGTEAEVSYNNLVYGNVKSCGCKKREHDKALSGFLTHVDGTSVDMLRSKKIPKNNTTGVKGVYLIKGKYVAKIVFQKKQYFLGAYDDLESAKEARLEAEEQINSEVISFYERWKALADADPEWAAENPIRIDVMRGGSGGLRLMLWPRLDESERKIANG